MKKNVMMRIAACLLVCVLASTCGISGTFAKYITEADGVDSARVAKWGVDINIVSGSSFSNEYKTHDTNYSGSVSVKSVDTENVVAPGTSSEDVDGSVTFSITGKPEVATRIEIEFIADSEIKLEAGEYLDYTTSTFKTDKFTLTDEYYPVKFTLTKQAGTGAAETVVDKGTLSDVETYLTIDTYADPNETLDVVYTLTWEWAFEGQNDKADTFLGCEDPAQRFAYSLTITVTQVD